MSYMIKKLLIVEYINGGGLAGKIIPPSLAAEGGMMLQTVLNELKHLPELTLQIALDRRSCLLSVPSNCKVSWVDDGQQWLPLLQTLIAECDAVWPIAPETDGILYGIAKMTEAAGKRLLLSSADTVALCADKLATNQLLIGAGIAAVDTEPCHDAHPLPGVLKPRDGVGCEGSFIVSNAMDYQQALAQIQDIGNYIVQPLLQGDAISLSCLFKSGQGWLLSCNRQQISHEASHFQLQGCLVNVDNPLREFYQNLVTQVANAIPGLWGYIGIDLIETLDRGPLVLEINPRLTTSYVGLREATGINVAEQVLQLLVGSPELPSASRNKVQVSIH